MKPIHFFVMGPKPEMTVRPVTLVVKKGEVILNMSNTDQRKRGWYFLPDFISSGIYKFHKTPKDVQRKVMELCAIARI